MAGPMFTAILIPVTVAVTAMRASAVAATGSGDVYPAVAGDWGYHTLRSGAQMFYWFMEQKVPELPQPLEIISVIENVVTGVTAIPPRLMILMEGDPLSSSTGVMNIGRLGPYDLQLRNRNTTPLSDASLLFIDSPIGSGWSFATTDSQYSLTYESVAADLTDFLTRHWFPSHSSLLGYDVTIFAKRSSARTAILLAKNLAASRSSIRLKHVILSGPDLSSKDTIAGMTQFLFISGNVEPFEKAELNYVAEVMHETGSELRYQMSKMMSSFNELVTSVTNGLYLQNIIASAQSGGYEVTHDGKRSLKLGRYSYRAVRKVKSYTEYERVMEGPVRRMFASRQNTTGQSPRICWGSQREKAATLLQNDEYTWPDTVIPALDFLLQTQDIRVSILSAQLDALRPTIGSFAALKRLKWLGREPFFQSRKDVFLGTVGGPQVFRKFFDKLAFYMVERSGHYVCNDKPDLFSLILKDIWLGPIGVGTDA